MKHRIKIIFMLPVFALVFGVASFGVAAPAHVAEKSDSKKSDGKKGGSAEKADAKKAGKIVGTILNGDADELWERKRYRGKTLYEDEDMVIYRSYDKNGRKYITKQRK